MPTLENVLQNIQQQQHSQQQQLQEHDHATLQSTKMKPNSISPRDNQPQSKMVNLNNTKPENEANQINVSPRDS